LTQLSLSNTKLTDDGMKSLAGKIVFSVLPSIVGKEFSYSLLDALRAYNARPKNESFKAKNIFRVSIKLLKYEWKSKRRRNALRTRVINEGL